MIAPAPVADTVSALSPQSPTKNGIFHSDETIATDHIPIEVSTDRMAPPSESDSADHNLITANGNDSTQHLQNALNGQTPVDSLIDAPKDDHKMAVDILKIIESYGVDYEKNGGSWKGLDSFVPIVVEQVRRQEPIRMILPAFPFKSPNSRDKVLGTMPDFGEELALSHLNGLCENIAQVYEPGANVYISSDGLVYNGELTHTSIFFFTPSNTSYQIFLEFQTKLSGIMARRCERWPWRKASVM
jgi:hypothetical protein